VRTEGYPLSRVRAIIYYTRTTVYPVNHPETPNAQLDLIEEVPAGAIVSIVGHYGRGRNTRYRVVRTDRRVTFELGSALAVNYRSLLQVYRARVLKMDEHERQGGIGGGMIATKIPLPPRWAQPRCRVVTSFPRQEDLVADLGVLWRGRTFCRVNSRHNPEFGTVCPAAHSTRDPRATRLPCEAIQIGTTDAHPRANGD